jgi:CubicO group peptidase (beta-lactamase class C family)
VDFCGRERISEAACVIDALMRAYQGEVPGACVAVLHNGSSLCRRAYGFADLENQVAATPATNFRLASITKQFTAAAILLLAEDGCLSIDDRIRQWLPSLPDAADGITVRHLLSHTSGLIDYEDLLPDGTSRQWRDHEVLSLLEAENRTYFAPAAGFRYSNSGYVLLALIARRAAGVDFASLLKQRIFQPLDMRNTVAFEAGVSAVAHRAYGYSAAGQSWFRTDQSPTSATLGDGGIYSSIDDLAKWDAALYDSRLLRAESLRLAFTPAAASADPVVQYGFGWRVSGAKLWHSGESVGFRNVIVRYPRDRFTVIVLTNRNDPEPYATALAIANAVMPGLDATSAAAAGTAAAPFASAAAR